MSHSPRISFNIFSNEVYEILDYLDEDYRFNVKTYSHSDFDEGELTRSATSILVTDSKKKHIIKLEEENLEIKLPEVSSSPLNHRKSTFLFTRRSSFDDKNIVVSDPITETRGLKTFTSYLVKYGVSEKI